MIRTIYLNAEIKIFCSDLPHIVINRRKKVDYMAYDSNVQKYIDIHNMQYYILKAVRYSRSRRIN